MTDQDVDRAIEALTDDEYESLSNQALSRWTVRSEQVAIVIGWYAAAFVCALALKWAVRRFWPGSYVASALALVILVVWLHQTHKAMLSSALSRWYVQRAIRREFKQGRWSKH